MLSELRERIPDRNLWVVYATMFVLSIAYGLAIALTPIVLEHRHLAADEIGSLASWFGLGIVSCAVPAGALIRRFTARATLCVCILGYAAMIGLFPFLTDYWHIAACRALDGAFSVGAWVSCETLLLARAEARSKAFVTSVYAIASGLGYVVGPIAAWLLAGVLSAEHTFVVAALIAAGSTVIAALRLDPDPPSISGQSAHGETEATPRRNTASLAWAIKMSSAATFLTGFFQSAAVLLLPIYLHEEKGVPEDDTRLVVAFAAGGMLVLSNLVGRLGDRFGHLAVMRTLASVGAVMLLVFGALTSFPAMGAALLVGGGSLLAMPPLSLALQGVIAAPDEYTRSNSIFNVFFASGLLLGPLTTGSVYAWLGGDSILHLFSGLWAAFVVLSLVFRRDDPRARAASTGRPSPDATVA